jgi:hypothetical protein
MTESERRAKLGYGGTPGQESSGKILLALFLIGAFWLFVGRFIVRFLIG